MNWLLDCIGIHWNRRQGRWEIDVPRVIGLSIGCAASLYLAVKVSEREPVRRAAVAAVPLTTFLKLLHAKSVKEVAYSETPPFGAIHFYAPAIGSCMSLLVPGSYDHLWSEVARSDCSVAAIQNISPLQKLGGVGFFFDLAGLLTSVGALLYMWKGSSTPSLEQARTSNVTFDQVAGMESTKVELREVIEYLSDPAAYDALGARPPRGVLLIGPSGTGKTLLAKAIAGESNVPFIYQSASSFVEIYVGQGAARVRSMFDLARAKAPCIIFIDELDAIGQERDSNGQGGSEYCQTLNQLLVELDGMQECEPWCFIGATNRYHALDSALTRPGRLDRIINVPLPDLEARHACLKIRLKDIIHDPEMDLWCLAEEIRGWNGAEITNMVNEAALLAARRKEPMVQLSHLNEVRDSGHSKRTKTATSTDDATQFDWRALQPFFEAVSRGRC